MRDRRRLEVWHRSLQLRSLIQDVIETLPRHEKYVLGDQMRRAATSVVSNIAEGAASSTGAEYARFLGIAARSAGELEGQLDVAARLNAVDRVLVDRTRGESLEIKKMLWSLAKRVRASHGRYEYPGHPHPPAADS